MHLVMIFLDGFGLGKMENNPIMSARTPNFDKLLGGHYLFGAEPIMSEKTVLRPIDASLGVEGVPQSATGQTTLWTGVNAAQKLGYHLNAYPNEPLAEIIKDKSIFKQLKARGKRVMFANAFTSAFDKALSAKRRGISASTLSALAGGIRLRKTADLIEGLAVYQDMTNEIMRQRGEEVPIITPFEAGQNLGRLALNYDFTLYELFQTDIKGHKQLWEESVKLIEDIDSFMGGFLSKIEDEDAAFILISDHGNIEDFGIKGHTTNPVPALCWSNRAIAWPEWTKLEEITPGIVSLMNGN